MKPYIYSGTARFYFLLILIIGLAAIKCDGGKSYYNNDEFYRIPNSIHNDSQPRYWNRDYGMESIRSGFRHLQERRWRNYHQPEYYYKKHSADYYRRYARYDNHGYIWGHDGAYYKRSPYYRTRCPYAKKYYQDTFKENNPYRKSHKTAFADEEINFTYDHDDSYSQSMNNYEREKHYHSENIHTDLEYIDDGF